MTKKKYLLLPRIANCHGRCDNCGENNKPVLFFGYDSPPRTAQFRICKDCFAENIDVILFGWDDWKDGHLTKKFRIRHRYTKEEKVTIK